MKLNSGFVVGWCGAGSPLPLMSFGLPPDGPLECAPAIGEYRSEI
jgi:hypothetical protein